MNRLAVLFGMIMMTAPAHADITHKLSSSVQLNVNSAATQVERIGSSYSVTGNNVGTTYTPSGGSAVSNGIGALTISSGVGSIPALEATQATAGESFSFTQNFLQGDAISGSAPTVGSVGNFSSQVTNAAGVAGDLAGTIDQSGTMAITAGGAGTSAVGQFTSEILIK